MIRHRVEVLGESQISKGEDRHAIQVYHLLGDQMEGIPVNGLPSAEMIDKFHTYVSQDMFNIRCR